jgi:hypothetical protein
MSSYRDPSKPEPSHWTLAELEAEVRRLAGALGARDDDLPTFDRQEDFARPNIEPAPWSPAGFAYVIVERGHEYERSTFLTMDDLLYRVFSTITFTLACRYELAHRVPDEDSRRIMFQAQVDLLARLSPSWADRERERIEAILREHPFDDAAVVRARAASRSR